MFSFFLFWVASKILKSRKCVYNQMKGPFCIIFSSLIPTKRHVKSLLNYTTQMCNVVSHWLSHFCKPLLFLTLFQLQDEVIRKRSLPDRTHIETPDRGPIPTSSTTRNEMDGHTKVNFNPLPPYQIFFSSWLLVLFWN